VALVIGCLALLCGYVLVTKVILHFRIALAKEQIDIFYEMRDKAAGSSPEEAAAYLEYAVGYYPSGTKQVAGSRLDRMVERVRRNVAEEIIANVRAHSGDEQASKLRKLLGEYMPAEDHAQRTQPDAPAESPR
jgi:hypothetical protein